jgi:hypothetical protein
VLALVVSFLLPERVLRTGEVRVEPAPAGMSDDGAWAFEGRALFDVLLLGEPPHDDAATTEVATEVVTTAPW